jgi:hypothetical protein
MIISLTEVVEKQPSKVLSAVAVVKALDFRRRCPSACFPLLPYCFLFFLRILEKLHLFVSTVPSVECLFPDKIPSHYHSP